jgi:hypothetical protein
MNFAGSPTVSYTASIDTDNAYQVASNKGFDDLCDWFDGLDWEEYPSLGHLRDQGWYPKVKTVKAELSKAIKANPPKPSVLKTIQTLLVFIGKNDPDGVLIFSQ